MNRSILLVGKGLLLLVYLLVLWKPEIWYETLGAVVRSKVPFSITTIIVGNFLHMEYRREMAEGTP